MDDAFDLPVIYKGEELLFPAQLLMYGYTHKIRVDVNGTEVLFEPDEERNYRALVDPSLPERDRRVDHELLQAIVQAIEALLK